MPLEQLLKASRNPAITGALSGMAGGALVSALTNRKTAKTLLKAGGVVAVGGLAYKAYQTYRDSQPKDHFGHPPEEQFVALEQSNDAITLVLDAMIAAANADGHLTETEKQKIWHQASEGQLEPMELARLSDKLNHPPSIVSLVQRAGTTELKVEVYTASILAMDENCVAGQMHLGELRKALDLPDQLAKAIHNRLENG